jgi:hypothetical protein
VTIADYPTRVSTIRDATFGGFSQHFNPAVKRCFIATRTRPDDELDDNPQTSTTSKTNPANAGKANGVAAPTPSNIQSWDADDDSVAAKILRSSGTAYVKVSEGNPARIAFVPGAQIVGSPSHFDQTDRLSRGKRTSAPTKPE